MLRPPMALYAIFSVRLETAVWALVFLFGAVGFDVSFQIFRGAKTGVTVVAGKWFRVVGHMPPNAIG